MKTSIVILTHNKLPYTKHCIESIRTYTSKHKYEIIIIDNNSTDGTVEWLREQKDIKVIYNKENLGFPRGCNQGIEIAAGENILLINNDTIVTENWLDNLLTCLYSSEEIGGVGPVTNNCSYYQTIKTNYQSIEEMHLFAKKYNISNQDRWEERLKLIGYCFLVKRSVVNKIGLLDERFSPGNFEDDDYSFRIRQEGYKLFLCKDTFIHHFGSVSFKDKPADFLALLKQNEKKFEEKWNFNSSNATSIRNEIVNLIDCPKDKKINVLDIGCACGGTLLKLKDLYKDANLFGIEINDSAARIASQFAHVKVQNIEDAKLDFSTDFFDYIILADVVEHLYDPWEVMKNIRQYLKVDGKILLSIKNIMHSSVLKGLINGNWTCKDKTQIRFFTLNEINKMLNEADYKNIEYAMTSMPKTEEDTAYIKALTELSNPSLTNQYQAFQYIVKASK